MAFPFGSDDRRRGGGLSLVSESSSGISTPQVSETAFNPKNRSGKGKKLKSIEKEEEKSTREVVHVRARRGQATDSHSLAERVRRGKINERLRCLKDIVIGCYKIDSFKILRENVDIRKFHIRADKGKISSKLIQKRRGNLWLSRSEVNCTSKRMKHMQCPLLCKEFVVDAWQIYYARSKGVDAILLIAAVLPDLDIKYMSKICKMVGLTPSSRLLDVY